MERKINNSNYLHVINKRNLVDKQKATQKHTVLMQLLFLSRRLFVYLIYTSLITCIDPQIK